MAKDSSYVFADPGLHIAVLGQLMDNDGFDEKIERALKTSGWSTRDFDGGNEI